VRRTRVRPGPDDTGAVAPPQSGPAGLPRKPATACQGLHNVIEPRVNRDNPCSQTLGKPLDPVPARFMPRRWAGPDDAGPENPGSFPVPDPFPRPSQHRTFPSEMGPRRRPEFPRHLGPCLPGPGGPPGPGVPEIRLVLAEDAVPTRQCPLRHPAASCQPLPARQVACRLPAPPRGNEAASALPPQACCSSRTSSRNQSAKCRSHQRLMPSRGHPVDASHNSPIQFFPRSIADNTRCLDGVRGSHLADTRPSQVRYPTHSLTKASIRGSGDDQRGAP
jgi:hypothetical protein